MRQSRTRLRREYRKKTIVLILIFALIMPIISILFGYLGAKHIILKYFVQPSPKKVSIQGALLREQQYTKYERELGVSDVKYMCRRLLHNIFIMQSDCAANLSENYIKNISLR